MYHWGGQFRRWWNKHNFCTCVQVVLYFFHFYFEICHISGQFYRREKGFVCFFRTKFALILKRTTRQSCLKVTCDKYHFNRFISTRVTGTGRWGWTDHTCILGYYYSCIIMDSLLSKGNYVSVICSPFVSLLVEIIVIFK